jgi:hypothetical protein
MKMVSKEAEMNILPIMFNVMITQDRSLPDAAMKEIMILKFTRASVQGRPKRQYVAIGVGDSVYMIQKCGRRLPERRTNLGWPG